MKKTVFALGLMLVVQMDAMQPNAHDPIVMGDRQAAQFEEWRKIQTQQLFFDFKYLTPNYAIEGLYKTLIDSGIPHNLIDDRLSYLRHIKKT